MITWLREELELRRLRNGAKQYAQRRNDDLRIAKARNASSIELYEISYSYYREDSSSDEISAITTARLLRRAAKLDLPVPRRTEGSDDYLQSDFTYAPILSQEAALRLRREIFAERELRQKPFLTWFSVVVSVLSLALAAAAYVGSSGSVP